MINISRLSPSQPIIPRKVMLVFVVADASDEMRIDGRIHKLDSALRELIRGLKHDVNNADTDIRIAILTVGTEPRWLTPDGPICWI